jgi:hypothetical protein
MIGKIVVSIEKMNINKERTANMGYIILWRTVFSIYLAVRRIGIKSN